LLLPIVAIAVGLAWWLNQPTPLELSRQLLRAGQTARAKLVLQRHLQENPADVDSVLLLAQIEGDSASQETIELLHQVPAEHPRFKDAVRRIALMGLSRADHAAAEAALKDLVRLDANDFASRLALAELYFNAGMASEALAHVREALKSQPDRAQTYLLLAETLDDLGRTSEMVEPLRQAARLDPENFSAHANLAYALKETGDIAQAKSEAEWCLARQPDAVFVRRILAAVLRDLGDLDAARRQVELVLKTLPDDLSTRLLEADLLLFQRDAEQAYSRLRPMYSMHPADRQVLSYIARAAQLTGRVEEARKYQSELLKVMENDSRK
jgi:tetratricopeptide (TPR) repeat protein